MVKQKLKLRGFFFWPYYKIMEQGFVKLLVIVRSYDTYCARTRQCIHQICIGQL